MYCVYMHGPCIVCTCMVHVLCDCTCVQELTTIQGSTQGKRMFSTMSGMLSDASTKLRLKNPDPEFVQHAEYMEQLAQQLAAMETTASKLFAERKGTGCSTKHKARELTLKRVH